MLTFSLVSFIRYLVWVWGSRGVGHRGPTHDEEDLSPHPSRPFIVSEVHPVFLEWFSHLKGSERSYTRLHFIFHSHLSRVTGT